MVVAVPNVSEGRDRSRIARFRESLVSSRGIVLDIHSDAVHNRSVFTVSAAKEAVVDALAALAVEARAIDLTRHRGAHPRIGGMDVCPIVAYGISMPEAVEIAVATGRAIAACSGLPVYLYGAAATRPETAELPALRRGGLRGLMGRAAEGLRPDLGPPMIDEHLGVVCVGARAPLIAFNVWLHGDARIARAVAARVRSAGGGPPAVRALGLAVDADRSQVSMNLVDPATTGIEQAFEEVEKSALAAGARVAATEIVGLVPERYAPDPKSKAARLLMRPSRSLESALSDAAG